MLDFVVDHLGLLVWIYLVVICLIDFKVRKLKTISRYILFGIGVIGIVLDLVLLVSFYYGFRMGWMFDILGLPVFCFIIWLARRDFRNRLIQRPFWTKVLLMIVGIGGLIADLFVLLYNVFWMI